MHIIRIGSDNKNLKSLEGMYICICFVLEQHLDYYDHCLLQSCTKLYSKKVLWKNLSSYSPLIQDLPIWITKFYFLGDLATSIYVL